MKKEKESLGYEASCQDPHATQCTTEHCWTLPARDSRGLGELRLREGSQGEEIPGVFPLILP